MTDMKLVTLRDSGMWSRTNQYLIISYIVPPVYCTVLMLVPT